ncbi:hypothetical protein EI555_017327, partial [Monodon monoceros]
RVSARPPGASVTKPGPAHLPPGCHHTARTKATVPSGRGPSPLLVGSLQERCLGKEVRCRRVPEPALALGSEPRAGGASGPEVLHLPAFLLLPIRPSHRRAPAWGLVYCEFHSWRPQITITGTPGQRSGLQQSGPENPEEMRFGTKLGCVGGGMRRAREGAGKTQRPARWAPAARSRGGAPAVGAPHVSALPLQTQPPLPHVGGSPPALPSGFAQIPPVIILGAFLNCPGDPESTWQAAPGVPSVHCPGLPGGPLCHLLGRPEASSLA